MKHKTFSRKMLRRLLTRCARNFTHLSLFFFLSTPSVTAVFYARWKAFELSFGVQTENQFRNQCQRQNIISELKSSIWYHSHMKCFYYIFLRNHLNRKFISNSTDPFKHPLQTVKEFIHSPRQSYDRAVVSDSSSCSIFNLPLWTDLHLLSSQDVLRRFSRSVLNENNYRDSI